MLVTPEVPVNGQVVASFSCQWFPPSVAAKPCNVPEAIAILDEAGEAVPGELTRSLFSDGRGAEYTFKPVAALAVDASYSLVMDTQQASRMFRVFPALTPDAALVSGTTVLAPQPRPLRSVCCEEAADSCGHPYCEALEAEYSASLSLVATIDPSQYRQWQVRVRGWDADGAERVSPWGELAFSISEQQAEYCIVGEFQSLVDGSTKLLKKECMPHGELPALGVHSESISPSIAQCAYPRPRTEHAWCAGTAERCEQGIGSDACDRWEQYCAAAPDAGAASSNVASSVTRDGGCALTAHSTARPSAFFCLALAAGLWFFRRREGSCRGGVN